MSRRQKDNLVTLQMFIYALNYEFQYLLYASVTAAFDLKFSLEKKNVNGNGNMYYPCYHKRCTHSCEVTIMISTVNDLLLTPTKLREGNVFTGVCLFRGKLGISGTRSLRGGGLDISGTWLLPGIYFWVYSYPPITDS